MCGLFGLMDCQESLTVQQKNQLLSALAIASESRGTDATGIAYNSLGKLRIYKRPWPGRCMHFRAPQDAYAVMGHTRMTTQGNYRRNFNNHPFPGRVENTSFALAHNGVLYNDGFLRQTLLLPKTRIKTDSYIAVQLIEKKKALTLDSLRYMAEQVRGSFTFTVLSESNDLYVVKGDSPFCLYYYPSQRLYVYCSTEELLQLALSWANLRLGSPEKVTLKYGDILHITPSGSLEWSRFQNDDEWLGYEACGWQFRQPYLGETAYLNDLKSVAGAYGFMPEQIERLYRSGFSLDEIEAALYGA